MREVTRLSYTNCEVSSSFQCGILNMSPQDGTPLGSLFLDHIFFIDRMSVWASWTLIPY